MKDIIKASKLITATKASISKNTRPNGYYIKRLIIYIQKLLDSDWPKTSATFL